MKLTDKERNLILAMCRNNLSYTGAAIDLHYHGNTVRYQIKRLEKKTGYDCSTFYGALILFLAVLWEDK